MRMLLGGALLAAALSSNAADGQGAPLLHAMFQDHAVLQRNAPIRVWGQAAPGTAAKVPLSWTRATARSDGGGRWGGTSTPT